MNSHTGDKPLLPDCPTDAPLSSLACGQRAREMKVDKLPVIRAGGRSTTNPFELRAPVASAAVKKVNKAKTVHGEVY